MMWYIVNIIYSDKKKKKATNEWNKSSNNKDKTSNENKNTNKNRTRSSNKEKKIREQDYL